jgi:PhoH-like ATPase
MQKTFVLDTSVLIHDSDAMFVFADNKVVIPMTVIEELDNLKKYRDDVGFSARKAIRNLDLLRKKNNLFKGVEINNGGILMVIPEKNSGDWPPGLDKNKKDNLIIKVAYDLLKSEKKVIFVSKDLNARIKADVLGIEAQDYEKEKVKIDQFEKGWFDVKVNDKIINEFYKDGKISIEKLKIDFTPFPNSYFLLKSETDENKSAIGKYDEKLNEIKPLKYDLKPVWGISALNLEQRFAFDLLLDPDINLVCLLGPAGTGKTLLAIAAGLKLSLDLKIYKKLLVSRPIVPLGKDIGYLPGSKEEKLSVWMQPIYDNLYFILNRTNYATPNEQKSRRYGSLSVVDYFIETGFLELAAVTYIRGRSIPDQYIIIDEAQNLTPHEMKTIISRVGHNSKIVLAGDPFQIDNPYLDSESNGLVYVAQKFKGQKIAGYIMLSKTERSPLASLAAEIL